MRKIKDVLLLEAMETTAIVIFLCSTLGLLISLYFTLVNYRIVRPDATFIPQFCRLDEATCQYLMSTRNARILGTPNFVLGLLYYSVMIMYVAVERLHTVIPAMVVTYVSVFTVLLGVYLVYGLIVKLKTNCVLCYTSHALNLVIFLCLLVQTA